MEAVTAKPKTKEPDPLDPALVLTHADLVALSKQMRKHVHDKPTLLAAIATLNRFTVDEMPVVLEPRLLERLKSRCQDKANFAKWLADVVVMQLHDYAGW